MSTATAAERGLSTPGVRSVIRAPLSILRLSGYRRFSVHGSRGRPTIRSAACAVKISKRRSPMMSALPVAGIIPITATSGTFLYRRRVRLAPSIVSDVIQFKSFKRPQTEANRRSFTSRWDRRFPQICLFLVRNPMKTRWQIPSARVVTNGLKLLLT